MTDPMQRLEEIIQGLVVARNVAIETAHEELPLEFENAEIAKVANELLERYIAEAKAGIVDLIKEARIEELEKFWNLELEKYSECYGDGMNWHDADKCDGYVRDRIAQLKANRLGSGSKDKTT
jgi:hypothetical protein